MIWEHEDISEMDKSDYQILNVWTGYYFPKIKRKTFVLQITITIFYICINIIYKGPFDNLMTIKT